MKMSHVWTTEDVFQLIAEVEYKKEVWDHSSFDYKNKTKRRTSLQQLADQFSTNCNEIVRKLHNLRTQLNNEYRRMKQKRLEGEHNYVPNWMYFEPMKYMLDAYKLVDLNNMEFEHVEVQMEPSSASQSSDSPDDTKSDYTLLSKKTKIEQETTSVPKTTITTINMNPTPINMSQISLSSLNNTPIINHTPQLQVQRSTSSYKDDETFGLFVTSALRNLRTDHCKRKMKRMIQKVILEAEEEDEILSESL